MKNRGQESIVIRIEVRRGKEVLFASIVPDDAGLTYEFPKALPLGFGKALVGVDVVPHVEEDVEAECEKEERDARLGRIPPARAGLTAALLKEEEPSFVRWVGNLFEGRPPAAPHEHRAKRASGVRAFAGCANPEDCTEAAHDGRTYFDVCECGARRQTNVNGMITEVGAWIR